MNLITMKISSGKNVKLRFFDKLKQMLLKRERYPTQGRNPVLLHM